MKLIYGAMDGASKFVKGDAIAGIIIIIINIVGGLIIGMVQKGRMTLSEAVSIYTILTIGDGLVVQIPALLISTATGIVVTKSASEHSLGKDVGNQLFQHPKALGIAAIILFALGTIGLPKLPMYSLAAFFGTLYFVFRNSVKVESEDIEPEELRESRRNQKTRKCYRTASSRKMEMELGYGLIPLVDAEQGGDFIR